jgi:hypothetical protein
MEREKPHLSASPSSDVSSSLLPRFLFHGGHDGARCRGRVRLRVQRGSYVTARGGGAGLPGWDVARSTSRLAIIPYQELNANTFAYSRSSSSSTPPSLTTPTLNSFLPHNNQAPVTFSTVTYLALQYALYANPANGRVTPIRPRLFVIGECRELRRGRDGLGWHSSAVEGVAGGIVVCPREQGWLDERILRMSRRGAVNCAS